MTEFTTFGTLLIRIENRMRLLIGAPPLDTIEDLYFKIHESAEEIRVITQHLNDMARETREAMRVPDL